MHPGADPLPQETCLTEFLSEENLQGSFPRAPPQETGLTEDLSEANLLGAAHTAHGQPGTPRIRKSMNN